MPVWSPLNPSPAAYARYDSVRRCHAWPYQNMGTVLVLLCTVQSTWHIPLMLNGVVDALLHANGWPRASPQGKLNFLFFSLGELELLVLCPPSWSPSKYFKRSYGALETIRPPTLFFFSFLFSLFRHFAIESLGPVGGIACGEWRQGIGESPI
ncbi:hypothetical protein BDV36DRAFT_275320 [Aspergillus pseudocaelatus]|uniref:Wax synthase domain-containing protein n=1 Tax=Aspergillus pseudocaelatus TaxID=1825620 RepID=A0ABQ6W2F5_9EURO|nr:hypothetical protein BDV36DRAFT_275320 [Aspergillus pseudocaelatus]